MKVSRAYRVELDPTNVQRTTLLRHAGAARFAYNWGLQRKQEAWWMNQLPVPCLKTPTAIDLHRELVHPPHLLLPLESPVVGEAGGPGMAKQGRPLDVGRVQFRTGGPAHCHGSFSTARVEARSCWALGLRRP